MKKLNNIELSLFSSRINACCEEMGEVLRLSAFSTNIKDRLDYSCAIFDAEGQLCAQAAHIPVHLGSMAYAMQDIVNQVTWKAGDMVAINDPYKGGTHLPDVTIIAPLFINNRLKAFVVNRAHHADIGATTPGSMPLSSSLEEEGEIISLEKIVTNNDIEKDTLARICSKMSDIKTSQGDFIAQISANHSGIKRLTALIEEMDVSNYDTAIQQLNDYGMRFSKKLLKQIPNGAYTFADVLDNDGMGTRQIKIKVKISVSDDCIDVNFDGTDKQLKGNINCPLSVTAAAVYYVFRCLMPEQAPACAGTFSMIKLSAPLGCFINAQYPAAVAAGNVETSMRIVDVVLGALFQAIPEKIPAASYGTMNNIAMGSRGSEREAWNYYETIGGGMGASNLNHGLDAVQAHMTNTLNTPIESLEYHFPMRVKEYAIRSQSGGNGKYQGGEGIVRRYELLDETEVTLLTDRRENSPWGLDGGETASRGENTIMSKGCSSRLPAKVHFIAKVGDIISIKTPGGGGYGNRKLTR